VFTEPLPQNGPGISVHLTVVAQQRLYTLQYHKNWNHHLERMRRKIRISTNGPYVCLEEETRKRKACGEREAFP
jgi:hypothetical protein